MAKKRSSTSSENEKSSGHSISSKKQLNKLLQSANLTSKYGLLKDGLINNELQNVVNGTNITSKQSERVIHENKHFTIERDSPAKSDSGDNKVFNPKGKQRINHLSKRKLNNTVNKIKKRSYEEVSSSSESSEDHALQIPINVKNERVSVTEESLSESDDNIKVSDVRKRHTAKAIDSNSSDLEEENNKFKIKLFPISQKIKTKSRTEISSYEDEKDVDLLDEPHYKRDKIGFDSTPTKVKKRNKYLSKGNVSTAIFGGAEEDKTKSILRKSHINSGIGKPYISTDMDSGSSEEDKRSPQKSPQSYERIMENIEGRMDKTTNSEGLLGSSSKNKVNVLQDICLSPPKHKHLKERLEEKYPGLKQLKNNMKLEFSDTEDIYLFRIPKNVDPSTLENVEVNLDEKCKIKIGKKYNIESTPNIPPPTLAVSGNCKILNFKGNIRMEKYVKSNKDANIVIPETKLVPLPDNLKKRHPLFGSDYKQKIKLSEHVKQKVDDAIESLLRQEGTKKKKRKKIKLGNTEENQKETIFSLLNSHSLLNSNKKIKTEQSADNASSSFSSTERTNKNTENNKHGINETLNRIKSEILTETESDHLEYLSPKKKKKNKILSNSWERTPHKRKSKKHTEDEEVKPDVMNVNLPKNENRLMINSTLISDMSKTPSFNPEISGITLDESNVKKRTKKSKISSGSDDDRSLIEKRLISDILDRLKSDLSPKKVKKKKVRQSE